MASILPAHFSCIFPQLKFLILAEASSTAVLDQLCREEEVDDDNNNYFRWAYKMDSSLFLFYHEKPEEVATD